MRIDYCCPFWGSEQLGIAAFFEKLKDASYDGVEVYCNNNIELIAEFVAEVEVARVTDSNFKLIMVHIVPNQPGQVKNYIRNFEKQLKKLTDCKPTFINAHTGKDYFSFDDNCRIIESALNISSKTGISIFHETHRGRFSFHAATLLPYLDQFPEMELVGDFSHFCTVSESLLQDQEEIIQQIIPHVSHIHARVGYEQSPQVNDPFAPEWENHLVHFIKWWRQIVKYKMKEGWKEFTVTPEFGPAPYMPLLPYTKQPVGNQWEINNRMKQYLSKTLTK